MPRLIAVTEANFSQHVLAASTMVIVFFAKRSCPGSRTMAPMLAKLDVVYAEQLRITEINVDTAPHLVEWYSSWAPQTLLIFQHGEVITRVVGFLSEGLLRVLLDQGVRGELLENTLWSPVEEVFEDTVLIPLLQQSGLHFQRQALCVLSRCKIQSLGRFDLLLSDYALEQPISLIESKRQISSEYQLQQAVQQASAYAQALCLRSFVVAAPSGMWIFQRDSTKAHCVREISSLELHHNPELLYRFLGA